jgi:hypothetical protein
MLRLPLTFAVDSLFVGAAVSAVSSRVINLSFELLSNYTDPHNIVIM